MTCTFEGGGGGLSFRNFRKKGGSDFSHKSGGVGKKGGGVSLIFILTLSSVIFHRVSRVCVCVCVCVFCLFTPFLSVLLVFHRKNLVL